MASAGTGGVQEEMGGLGKTGKLGLQIRKAWGGGPCAHRGTRQNDQVESRKNGGGTLMTRPCSSEREGWGRGQFFGWVAPGVEKKEILAEGSLTRSRKVESSCETKQGGGGGDVGGGRWGGGTKITRGGGEKRLKGGGSAERE